MTGWGATAAGGGGREGGGGAVNSVTGPNIDNTDPANPVSTGDFGSENMTTTGSFVCNVLNTTSSVAIAGDVDINENKLFIQASTGNLTSVGDIACKNIDIDSGSASIDENGDIDGYSLSVSTTLAVGSTSAFAGDVAIGADKIILDADDGQITCDGRIECTSYITTTGDIIVNGTAVTIGAAGTIVAEGQISAPTLNIGGSSGMGEAVFGGTPVVIDGGSVSADNDVSAYRDLSGSTVKSIVSNFGSVSLSAGGDAGAGASAAEQSGTVLTHVAGRVRVTTGTGAAAGELAVITLDTDAIPTGYIVTAIVNANDANSAAANLFVTYTSASVLTIESVNALADETNYDFTYHIIFVPVP